MSNSTTDQDIVRATLEDRNSFALLVERYEAPLSRYIRRLGCTDSDLGKDILQESFINAYTNLNDYDAALSFSSWMYRITHNVTIDHFRKIKNRPQPVQDEKDLDLFEKIADDLDVTRETDTKLRARHVATAVSQLKREYRDVVVLRFFEEKSYEEISDILRIPEGTVATYIARSKKELRAVLKKYNVTDIL